MNYFITGATGLIGRFLVERLVKRPHAVVYLLIREQSAHKFKALQRKIGASDKKLIAVYGDVTQAGLVSEADAKKLHGKIDHLYHLAAVYDMNMSEEQGDRINNEGTRNVIQFAADLGPNKDGDPVRLHHVSSVAVAGNDFAGVFRESMFDEGQNVMEHPYYRTKFQSEKIIREECKVPWRIYRPGMVLGDSATGEMDKVDGPYYLFKSIQRVRDALPKWLPLLMIEGGYMPLAPVDYVADAMVGLGHADDLDGQAFHLVQSEHPTVGELMKIFFEACHGPSIVDRFEPTDIPGGMIAREFVRRTPETLQKLVSDATGVPISIFGYIENHAVFDDSNTRKALKEVGVKCPQLKDYAQNIWNYWEVFLDMEVDLPKHLPERVAGKVALVTGASSGIGYTTAKKLGKAGARVLLVARGEEQLKVTKHVIEKLGGTAHIYPTDLTDLNAIDKLVETVLNEHGHVDILVNNAGRSIRRSVWESFDRFHDFERTMQLNYFSCIRLIMGFLPTMGSRKSGHIINISSIGCLTNVPRFAAYVASKSALDAYSRCLSAEVRSRNIDLTTIYMPLVRTPMIAPTKIYDYVPTLTPGQAADMICEAIIKKPKSIKSPLGTAMSVSYALWPKVNDFILSQGYKLFPSSAAAQGKGEKPSRGQQAFNRLFKGTYW